MRDQLVGGAKSGYALRAEISAAVAATHAYTSEAREAASGTQTAAAALSQASEAARATVTNFVDDYYGKKIFDPYLRFASAEDEEEFHRREEERRLAIEKAMKEHSPQGDLRANRIAIDQMHDAGAHGADSSPDYQSELNRLTAARDNLEAELAPKPAVAKPVIEANAVNPASALLAAGVSLADTPSANYTVPRQSAVRGLG